MVFLPPSSQLKLIIRAKRWLQSSQLELQDLPPLEKTLHKHEAFYIICVSQRFPELGPNSQGRKKQQNCSLRQICTETLHIHTELRRATRDMDLLIKTDVLRSRPLISTQKHTF